MSAKAVLDEGAEGEERVELDRSEASQYRATAARANHMGFGRLDAQYAIKAACRGKARPADKEIAKTKTLTRHLQWAPSAVLRPDCENDGGAATQVYVDAAWVRCSASRRGTSVGSMTSAGLW